MKKLTVVFFIFLLSVAANGMEKIKMEFSMDITPVGDARITYKQSATAGQWRVLNQTVGQNPALLRREITHELSAYELSNFKFSKDPMNRTFVLEFDAAGIAMYKGNGEWVINVEKELSAKKLSNRSWYLTNTYTDGNVLYEISFTVNLPEKVAESHITTDELGKKVLKYKLPQKRKFPFFLALASISFLIGIVLITVSFIMMKDIKGGRT